MVLAAPASSPPHACPSFSGDSTKSQKILALVRSGIPTINLKKLISCTKIVSHIDTHRDFWTWPRNGMIEKKFRQVFIGGSAAAVGSENKYSLCLLLSGVGEESWFL